MRVKPSDIVVAGAIAVLLLYTRGMGLNHGEHKKIQGTPGQVTITNIPGLPAGANSVTVPTNIIPPQPLPPIYPMGLTG